MLTESDYNKLRDKTIADLTQQMANHSVPDASPSLKAFADYIDERIVDIAVLTIKNYNRLFSDPT